jgi:hypothetical protein
VAVLVTVTGPIAVGKNTVASAVVALASDDGLTVVSSDVDDVAATVGPPGAAASGLWSAAHDAHGAMVARWLASEVDLVVAVGPFHTHHERALLLDRVPDDIARVHVLLDAPLDVTWERALADPTRGISRQREFHEAAHARFRSLVGDIPADLRFDTGTVPADVVAARVLAKARGLLRPGSH